MYKYTNPLDFDVSDYQTKDIAVYDVHLSDNDVK